MQNLIKEMGLLGNKAEKNYRVAFSLYHLFISIAFLPIAELLNATLNLRQSVILVTFPPVDCAILLSRVQLTKKAALINCYQL